MKTRLRQLIDSTKLYGHKYEDMVLEMFAGVGRNWEVLKRYFRNIDMVEQSPAMTKHIHKTVNIYQVTVQNFEWPKFNYDCIVICWGLCYLDRQDINDLLIDIDKGLKDGGRLILFEPVLDDKEEQQDRLHKTKEQQMVIRPKDFYDKLFLEDNWIQRKREVYVQDGINNEDIIGYVYTKVF